MTGRGAAEWLDHILACKIPPVGRMVLAPMLKHDGKIIGDFSLARLADDVFNYWFGSPDPTICAGFSRMRQTLKIFELTRWG